MKHPVYTVYGLVVLFLLGAVQFLGLPFSPALSQSKHIPRTVRDNPGSSRSSYGWFPHIFGGK